MTARRRGRGDGSIYPYRGHFAAYVWVTNLDGRRERKYVYGQTREEVHTAWLKLHQGAARGPVAVRTPLVREYLTYWLQEVVTPTLKPKTAETYAMHVRLYIEPTLGAKRLEKLTVRDVRQWLNRLGASCQCCAQGKDAARPPNQRRCCAIGDCCEQQLSRRTVQDIRAVLRSALNTAITDEFLTRNVAEGIKLPSARRRRVRSWSVEEARQFLVNARQDGDPLYPAYVLMLVLGLRRGELLGLMWPMVDLDRAEIDVLYGLQRIGGRLVNGHTKTPDSDATLPLPEICVTALRLQAAEQDRWRVAAAQMWADSGYVVTTHDGMPMDPRNFYRSFQTRCIAAGVRQIPVHGTRHTCGSLLAALDVHPRVAMQILRHSKIDITMDIYTHVPSDLTRLALRKLGEQLNLPATAVGNQDVAP